MRCSPLKNIDEVLSPPCFGNCVTVRAGTFAHFFNSHHCEVLRKKEAGLRGPISPVVLAG